MTPEKWQQVKDVFQAVLDFDPPSRESHLDRLCGDDTDVRREVESLLDSYRHGEPPIAVPEIEGMDLEEAAASLADRRQGAQAVTSIGRYRVLRELGRGGMSTVYLAYRADQQYRMRVAIKLLRPAMASDDVMHRFRRERQILAGLDHPNIARLLDGGTTPDGLPYFVLEYVEGVAIDRFCDARRLPLTERLHLFRTVCSAVQHAHRNLVVHRDLKPGNILITDDGTPKLLDFGIAKLLNPELSSEALHSTAATMRLMTPGYASPEQVQGRAITTTSDVYSLGVLLYELLTGHRPYAGQLRDAAGVERAICHEEPTRPSSVVGRRDEAHGPDDTRRRADTPESVSAARQSSPARLRRQLTGDLDAVLLKALRKAPHDRYTSVEQLSDDLGRHLEGLPVDARGGDVRYRTDKFVRRHRTGVIAATLTLAALLAGLAGTAWQARVARTERARAEAERDRAEQLLSQARAQRARADQVSSYLIEIFRLSDPHEALGNLVSARDILDRGAEKIAYLAGQPELQAALMHTLGQVYQNLGLFAPATELLGKALDIRRQWLGEQHLDVAETMNVLAQTLHLRDELVEAERLYRSSLEIRRRQLGPEHLDVADSLTEIAELHFGRAEYAAAEALFREGLEIRRRRLGGEHPLVAESLDGMADVVLDQGDYEAAERLYRQALEIRQRRLDPEHPDVAGSLNGLATALHLSGDHGAAERLYRQSLEIREKRLGAKHPAVAQSLSNLGRLLQERGDLGAAEPLHRRALEIRRRRYGEESVLVAESLNHLATVLYNGQDYAAAQPLYRQALKLNRKLRGEEHPNVARNLLNLGLVLRDQGEYDAAETAMREALLIQRKALGDDSPEPAFTLGYLAFLLQRKGELEAAGAVFRDAVAMSRKLLPDAHPRLAIALVGLGQVLTESRRAEEARPLLEEAVEIFSAVLPAVDWRTAVARSSLGACLVALGRFDEAEPLLVESYPLIRATRGEQDLHTRQARQRIVRLYQAWGRPAQASAYAARRE